MDMAFDQLLEECLAAVPDRAAEKKRWRAELGITDGIVSKYIAGKHVPRDKWAAEWARVLDRPPEDVARAFYISRSGSAARAVPEHDHPELQGMIDQLFSLYRQLAGLSTASGHTGDVAEAQRQIDADVVEAAAEVAKVARRRRRPGSGSTGA